MSSENESEQPQGGEFEAEPTTQFDAFRARMADDREQQETQTSYTFPPEYAADPTVAFDPARTAAPFSAEPFSAPPPYEGVPYGGEPYGAGPFPTAAAGRSGANRRGRSIAIFGGAAVLVCALGFGAWAAFGSSSPSNTAATSGTGVSATATTSPGADAGKRAKTLTFRVTIHTVGADSFSGAVLADGSTVTVALTDKTHYGTKAHPFAQSDLTAGETVIVRGRRTDSSTVTATLVEANAAATASPGATGGTGSAA